MDAIIIIIIVIIITIIIMVIVVIIRMVIILRVKSRRRHFSPCHSVDHITPNTEGPALAAAVWIEPPYPERLKSSLTLRVHVPKTGVFGP